MGTGSPGSTRDVQARMACASAARMERPFAMRQFLDRHMWETHQSGGHVVPAS